MNFATHVEIAHEIKRLGAVYKPPAGEPEYIARIWAEVLEGVSADDLRAAVGEYLRGTGRYFPRPAAIRELATQRRQSRGDNQPQDPQVRYNQWSETHGTPCPICGAVLQVLGHHWGVPVGDFGRYGTLHDEALHSQARVPYSGYPMDRDHVKRARNGTADHGGECRMRPYPIVPRGSSVT